MSPDETSRLANRGHFAIPEDHAGTILDDDPPARPMGWPGAFALAAFFASVAFTIVGIVWAVVR